MKRQEWNISGFAVRKWERCEDCDLRGALQADGRVRTVAGHRFSAGCQNCDGVGHVPPRSRLDPYRMAA